MLATITVTDTGDNIANNAAVTLREAITAIDLGMNTSDVSAVGAYGTNDTIKFGISGAGVKTFSPGSALPTITKPVLIDGYSQGGTVNTLVNADNAVLLIELNGTNAGSGVSGLTLGAGSGGTQIDGLAINRFAGNGVVVQSNGNFIIGNFIGVDTAGATREPNGTFPSTGDGVLIQNASSNTIGGAVGNRNIISGNAIDGVHIVGTLALPATGNTVAGNFIGVAADGKSSVGNRTEPAPAPGSADGNNLFGIEISGGNNNTVGGTTPGARNVVGFNGTGITINNGGQGNTIQGNYSGVGADGVTAAGNLLHGIDLRSSNGFAAPLGPAQANEPGVSNNTIGGTVAGAGNLIEFNGQAGVAVFGNPVSVSGQANVGNSILSNSIFLNGRSSPSTSVGIDLTNGFTYPKDDGPTPNDSKGHGAANDPNSFQDAPIVTSVTQDSSSTTINGSLHSAPNTTYRIEVFGNDPDPSGGIAEGQEFLGFQNTTTNGSGDGTFTLSINFPLDIGQSVTATATDPTGNTSEFSAAALGPPPSFVVTNTNNTGPGSLRQVITDANAYPGIDTITFNIPGAGPHVIAPPTNFPDIKEGVTIDATSQPDFDPSTNVPTVVLDGQAGAGIGLAFLSTSSNSTVKGLEVIRFIGEGIIDASAPNFTVTGNYIGTDGTHKLANNLGVYLQGASKATIGGTTPDARNIISGNTVGVVVQGSQLSTVLGNYIGTDATGTAAIANGSGVQIENSASDNIIGGTTAGARNIISGNTTGVEILGSNSNKIQGNYIGMDVTGEQALANNIGIDISTGSLFNIVGGVVPGAGNVISANLTVGIEIQGADATVVQGNLIGTDAAGVANFGNMANVKIDSALDNVIGGSSSAAANVIAFSGTDGIAVGAGTGNALRLNSIYGSAGKGISLHTAPNFVLPNDPMDTDTGPNNQQNFPVLTSAVVAAGATTITGLLNSTPNTQFVIDLYSNPTSDSSGHGEGQTYLGTVGVTTDQNGNASFSTTLSKSVATDSVVTATATTIANAPHGDTSEFAADIDVTGPAAPPPPPPAAPTLSINNVSHSEQNSGTHSYTFTVTRSGDTTGTSDVFYSTADGSATAGSDYIAIAPTALHFAANQITAQIIVNEQGDTAVEGDETFFVNLANPTNATITNSTGIGTIVNDDAAPPPPPASGSVSVVTDPCDSTKTALEVDGTDGKDTITVTKSGSSQGKAVVKINGVNKGTYSFTGSIVVYGKGGADNISIDSAITRSAYIWGGDGNDTINGGGGNDIIFGQANDDSINGNSGRDILVGGDGTDKLNGGSGDDLLIAGDFKSAPSMPQLCSIQKELTRTDKNYAARVKDLTNGGGFNSIKLNGSTLFSSTTLKDSMTGGSDNDLFFAAMSGDKITDKASSETTVNIG